MKTRESKSYIDLINEFNRVQGAKFKFYDNNNSNPNFRIDDSSKLKRQHQEALGNINRQNLEERNRLTDQFGRQITGLNANIGNLTNERNLHLQSKNSLQAQFNALNSQFAPLRGIEAKYNALNSQYSGLSKQIATKEEELKRFLADKKQYETDIEYWKNQANYYKNQPPYQSTVSSTGRHLRGWI